MTPEITSTSNIDSIDMIQCFLSNYYNHAKRKRPVVETTGPIDMKEIHKEYCEDRLLYTAGEKIFLELIVYLETFLRRFK